MCGIIGIQNNKEAATFAYMGLYAQQHRGQEGAGVVSSDGKELHRHMGQGLVSDVFSNPEVFDSYITKRDLAYIIENEDWILIYSSSFNHDSLAFNWNFCITPLFISDRIGFISSKYRLLATFLSLVFIGIGYSFCRLPLHIIKR